MMRDTLEALDKIRISITDIAHSTAVGDIKENNAIKLMEIVKAIENIEAQDKRVEILRLLETAECNKNPETIAYCKAWLEEIEQNASRKEL